MIVFTSTTKYFLFFMTNSILVWIDNQCLYRLSILISHPKDQDHQDYLDRYCLYTLTWSFFDFFFFIVQHKTYKSLLVKWYYKKEKVPTQIRRTFMTVVLGKLFPQTNSITIVQSRKKAKKFRPFLTFVNWFCD